MFGNCDIFHWGKKSFIYFNMFNRNRPNQNLTKDRQTETDDRNTILVSRFIAEVQISTKFINENLLWDTH